MRTRLSLATVLVAALAPAVALAAPATAAAPLAAGALLQRSAAALEKKRSLHLDVTLQTSATGDGSVSAARLKKLAPPTAISVSGAISETAVSIAGKLSADGQTLAAELRTSGNELYVNFAGRWYGVKDTKAKGSSVPLDTSPKELTKALADILRSGLDVTVGEGPTTDGVATWKLEGSFDPKALAKASKSSGLGSAGSSLDLATLAGKTDVTLLIGRDDELPRRMEIASRLGPKDLASADSSTGGLLPLPDAGSKGVKSVTVTVKIAMSKFGEKVAFQRPGSFTSLDKLFGELLGGAMTTTKKTA